MLPNDGIPLYSNDGTPSKYTQKKKCSKLNVILRGELILDNIAKNVIKSSFNVHKEKGSVGNVPKY